MQVELAFREQTAGNNAMSLFVYLAFQLMETQLRNAFADVAAKQAEVCPLDTERQVVGVRLVSNRVLEGQQDSACLG